MTRIVNTEVIWIVRYSTSKVASFRYETFARQYYEEKVKAGRKEVKLIKQTTTVTEEVLNH
jgi:hypothetical protein